MILKDALHFYTQKYTQTLMKQYKIDMKKKITQKNEGEENGEGQG